MFVLGLTGSIGMGKSTTAGLFRRRGVPVHDADAVVHSLYAGAAVPAIRATFPEAVPGDAVDRTLLAKRVMGDGQALAQLEAIVHPLVREAEVKALRALAATGIRLVVLDIPLLFETGAQTRCDGVAVVSAPAPVQRARVLARPGMTAERFAALSARQWSDGEKRRHAHFVIDTGRGIPAAQEAVDGVLRALAGRDGGPYP